MPEDKANDPKIIWMRPERPARGPAPAHTRAQITEVAVKIADTEGLAGLSMRKVAAALGAGTMSLYRYVPSRDELVQLMVDAVLGEVAGVRATGDWRGDLTAAAYAYRDMLGRHPWMVTNWTAWTWGPNGVEVTERMLEIVDGLGLDIDEMVSATGMVFSFVQGSVGRQTAAAEQQRRTGLTTDELMDAAAPYVMGILETGRYPLLKRVIIEAAQPHMSPDEAFGYGLALTLEAISGMVR